MNESAIQELLERTNATMKRQELLKRLFKLQQAEPSEPQAPSQSRELRRGELAAALKGEQKDAT